MAVDDLVSQARNAIDAVLNTLPSEIIRKEHLGSTLAFTQIEADLDAVKDLLRPISDMALAATPDSIVSALVQSVSSIESSMAQMRAFRPGSNPEQVRDSLINTFKSQAAALIREQRVLSLFSALQELDPKSINARIDGEVNAALKPYASLFAEVEERLVEVDGLKARAEAIVTSLTDEAANRGISQHKKIFSEVADANAQTADSWLKCAIGVAIFTFVVAAFLSVWGLDPTLLRLPTPDFAQLALTKVLLIGMGVSAALWCGVNYRSMRHLVEVSRHRANALATYEIFAASTIDPQERGVILLQSAQAIFSNMPTGYLGKESGDSSPAMVQFVQEAAKTVGLSKAP